MHTLPKYILLVALGALSYGMLSSFAKIAYKQGYNAAEITFMQAFIGALLLWIFAMLKNKKKEICYLSGGWKLVLAGTSMGASAYTYYLSVEYIPASLAIVLLMQVTWISILTEWLFAHKRPSAIEIRSTFFILAGTVLASKLMDTDHFETPFIGIVLALLSALLYALYVLFTSKLGNETPLFEKSALMTSGSALMIFLINIKSITTSTHLDWGLLQWGTFLAIFGTVIPPICFTVGMPKIGPAASSILLTLELPAAIFCAHLILNEPVSLVQIGGVIIMLGAIIYLNLAKAKKEKRITNNLI